jgi:nucleoside-diphosphate-sugar epimerase
MDEQGKQKRALVLGAGGFIGGHLCRKLRQEGYWVRGVDLKQNPWMDTGADEFIIGDLTDKKIVEQVFDHDIDEVYQMACKMGGACFVFTGANDANIMHNSALIDLHVCGVVKKNYLDQGKKCKVFFSGSACCYNAANQLDPDNPNCAEDSAYPANPDSDYGFQKLFAERLYFAFHRNYGMDIRIARFHNIFGPHGSWNCGREKAPAALCRKVAMCPDGGEIEVIGDGKQTRSFLYIDECIEGVRRLMNQSDFIGPVNIGSEEMVSIDQFANMIIELSGKKNITIKHIEGPVGVKARNSDNKLILEKLGWKPSCALIDGLKVTYAWISQQIADGIPDYQYNDDGW